MRKAINFVKDNKKIILIITLIIVLVGTVYFLNSRKKVAATSAETPKTATEIKLGGILKAIEGVGAADVMINENDGKILGVVIVCQGADNIMVKNDILNAASTALGVDKKIIAIYSMK